MDTSSEVKTLVAFTPRALSGEVAVSGTVIDRKGYESAVFTLVTGEYTSDPTGINVECKVQHSSGESGTGTYHDVLDLTDTDTPVIHTHISGEVSTLIQRQTKELSIDLRPCSRYVKLVATYEVAGGTNPVLYFASTVTLGEPTIKPTV